MDIRISGRNLRTKAGGDGGPPSGPAGGDLTGTYPNPDIKAGVIVDGDIAVSAAIDQGKINGLTTALAGKADVGAVGPNDVVFSATEPASPVVGRIWVQL